MSGSESVHVGLESPLPTMALDYHLRVLSIHHIFNSYILAEEWQHTVQEDNRQKPLYYNYFFLSIPLLLCETKFYEILLISQDPKLKSPVEQRMFGF